MFENSSTFLSLAAVGILIGVAVWALLYGLVLVLMGPEARIKARVRQFVANQAVVPLDEDEIRAQQRATLFAEVDKRWENRNLFKRMREDLEAANVRMSPTELLFIQIALGVGVGLILWAVVPVIGFLLAPVGFALGVVVAREYVKYLGKRRVQRFEEQLPNNLAILASSVRSGFSLFQALQMMSREAPEPSKTEFTRVIQEISLGQPLAVSLEGLSKRVPTEDVDILVTAIVMQQQTGGNLTHVLDIVSATIRERHRVEREIRTLTAQQRFSSILLAALPFILGVVLFYISPAYMSNLFQPGWVLCLPVGAILMSIVGFLVMRRLADIDV